jgi:hypothetical protein
MRSSVTNLALLAAVATLFFTGPAWAYLDPGTGSMMLQLLLGGIAGAMVMGKLYWHRLRGFLTSRFSGKPRNGARAYHASASSREHAADKRDAGGGRPVS